MMKTRRAYCLFAMLPLLAVCGCGGCGESENVPVKVPPKKPVQAAAQGPPPVPVRRDAPKQVRPIGPVKKTGEASTLPPGVDPNDVFTIVTEPATCEVLGPEPEVEPADIFLAELPPPGCDSSDFVVVERGTRPIVGEPNPDLVLPEGFSAIAVEGYSPDGFPLRLYCRQDGSVMALVSGGTFVQGRSDISPDVGPEHTHYLDPYYIQVTEVTVAQFEMFRKAREEMKLRVPTPPLNADSPGDYPALGVMWGDMRSYALWTGRDLPTEAEWEKAARGPDSFAHPWGNGRAIWGRPRSQSQIDPVKSFLTDMSVYGVYDLAGNAREWCSDWYSETAYQQAVARGNEPLRNWKGPRAPSQSYVRVVKGNGPNWEAWHRTGISIRERPADVGFRCVLRADPAALEKLHKDAEKPAEKASR